MGEHMIMVLTGLQDSARLGPCLLSTLNFSQFFEGVTLIPYIKITKILFCYSLCLAWLYHPLCMDNTILSFKFEIQLCFLRKVWLEPSDSVMLLYYRSSLRLEFPLPIYAICNNLLPVSNHIPKPSLG